MRRLLPGGAVTAVSLLCVSLLLVGDRPARRPRPVAPSLVRQLEQAVAAREYEASENAHGLQAPNRAQGLRSYFEPWGVRIVDRTAPGAPELAQLRLSGFGRVSELRDPEAGEVSHHGARVEIRRPGLVEWYQNAPAGLEQGFTLTDRPDGAGALAFELAIPGPELRLSGNALLLRAPSGRLLRYGAVHALDARGRALPARLELSAANRARLVVDDSGARYPIAIDPLLTQSPETVTATQTEAGFGSSIASAGDTNGDGYADLIVGAPGYDSGAAGAGAAFVFDGGPNGITAASELGAQARLASSQSSSRFGESVASAGDVNGDGYDDVIVSAPGYSDGQQSEGAAFIFQGGPSGIQDGGPGSAATKLQGDLENEMFGGGPQPTTTAVAGAGDVNGDGYDDVIVGATQDSGVGAAFVFYGGSNGVANGSRSTAQAVLRVVSQTPPMGFGWSVASAGDVNGDGLADVIVGAYPGDFARLYLGGTVALGDRMLDFPGSAGSGYGIRVASAGNVNGDAYSDVLIGSNDGVSVFLGNPTIADVPAGAPAAQLTSTQGGAFGRALASGDVNGDGFSDVIVGAPSYAGSGAVFVYFGAGGIPDISPGGIASGDETTASLTLAVDSSTALGTSLGAADVDGDGIDDILGGSGGNAAYIDLGRATGLSRSNIASPNAAIEGNQANEFLGSSVASAGDLDGYGYSDVIVGVPLWDGGEVNEGAAFVFFGTADGIQYSNPSGSWKLHSNQSGAQFGASVASAGDVNGDGYDDVIVGAPFYDDPERAEGAAFVFLGGPAPYADGTPANAYARFESDQDFAFFGTSVASAGDVNGDGRADVIVGAPEYGADQGGAAFVFVSTETGLASGTPVTAAVTIASDAPGAELGASVASAGDVNGDGFGDVIVGAPDYAVNEVALGSAWIVRGGPNGSDPNAVTRVFGAPDSLFGTSVAGAGDVNGDGFDDVIVGAPAQGNAQPAAYIFAGAASLPPNDLAPATVITDDDPDSELGESVASAGDVNSDGYADVLIGAPNGNGAVFAFYGGPNGIPSGSPLSAPVQILGNEPDSQFGASVAGAGDVNGDGFADIVVGAPLADGAGADAGFAYVFYGSGQPGRPVLTWQQRNDGSGRFVQAWGDGHGIGSFIASTVSTHPRVGRVRAQVEACPSGVPFGSPGCISASSPQWQNPYSQPVLTPVTVSGLAPSTLYRWHARTLYADLTGPIPPAPAHGPWRTFESRAANGDVRASSTTDSDGDGVPDAVDNCPHRANPGQEDAGGFGSDTQPDFIGDMCQCGNLAGNGRVMSDDVVAYRKFLANPATLTADARSRCVVIGTGADCTVLQVSVLRRVLHFPPVAQPLTSTMAAQVCAATRP